MITKENLTELLKALGFHKEGATHSKSFGAATLAVNISKEEPTLKTRLVAVTKVFEPSAGSSLSKCTLRGLQNVDSENVYMF